MSQTHKSQKPEIKQLGIFNSLIKHGVILWYIIGILGNLLLILLHNVTVPIMDFITF